MRWSYCDLTIFNISTVRQLGFDEKWILTFPQHLGRYSLHQSTEFGAGILIRVRDTHRTRN